MDLNFTRDPSSCDEEAVDCSWDEVGDWFEYWTVTVDTVPVALTLVRAEPEDGQEYWFAWAEKICGHCGKWGSYAIRFNVHCLPSCAISTERYAVLGSTIPGRAKHEPVDSVTSWYEASELDGLSATIVASSFFDEAQSFAAARLSELDSSSTFSAHLSYA